MSTQLVFIVVAMAALAAESGGNFANSGGNAYCKFDPNHSLCLKTKPCAAAESDMYSAIDEAGIKEIVDTHNEIRSKVARGLATGFNNTLLPPAADMMKMFWDPELAEIAQAHANKCQFVHDCFECRKPIKHNFWSVGQNGFISGAGPSSPPDLGGAVKAWYSEMNNFKNFNQLDHYQWEVSTAHATQVIWSGSYLVGCGYIVFKEGGGYKKLIFCNYAYGGNTGPYGVYTPGKSCSKCLWGQICDKDYLCYWEKM